jgi:lactoylglutathione lyase
MAKSPSLSADNRHRTNYPEGSGEHAVAKAIHAMIRVLDEARSVDFYKRAFDLEVADRYPFDGFTLVYLRNQGADFELELTVNHSQTEPYELGNGYGHIAFVVGDLEAEHARFQSENLEPKDIVSFQRDGALMARFFFVQDPDGYKIEVLQQHGRYR